MCPQSGSAECHVPPQTANLRHDLESSGDRPVAVARYRGERDRRVWLMYHYDLVEDKSKQLLR